MILRSAVLPLSLAIFLGATSARSAPRPRHVGVRLEYQRGPRTQQCPDTADFRAEVAAWLGRDPFTEAGPWRLIAIISRRRDGAFLAMAELFDENGASVRSFDPMAGGDCSYLLRTVLAERIAAELAEAPPLPSPTPPIVLISPPNATTPAPVVSSPPSPPSLLLSPLPELRWWMGGAVGATAGVLPTWVPTLSLSLGVRSKVASMSFEVQTSLPLHGVVEGGTVVHASSGTGSLVGCYRGILDGLVFLCSVTTAGVFVGGTERYRTGDTPGAFAAGGVRGGVEIPGSSNQFAFYLEGDLLYTFTPVTVVQNDQDVWHSGDVTGALRAGVRFFL